MIAEFDVSNDTASTSSILGLTNGLNYIIGAEIKTVMILANVTPDYREGFRWHAKRFFDR